jgi:hypothetical protein
MIRIHLARELRWCENRFFEFRSSSFVPSFGLKIGTGSQLQPG